jgi:hypothetical protein
MEATFVCSHLAELPSSTNGRVVPLSETSEQIHPQLIHFITPGHSADGLSIYDATERRLYVGDLIQPHVPTMMGPDADWNSWNRTLGKLISLVDDLNEESSTETVPSTPHISPHMSPSTPAVTLGLSPGSSRMESPRPFDSIDTFSPKMPPPMSFPAAAISQPSAPQRDWSSPTTLQRYQTMTPAQLEEIAQSLFTKPQPNAGRVILACGHGHQPMSAGEDASRALRIMAGLATGVRGVIVSEFSTDGTKLPKGDWIQVKDQQHEKFGILAMKSIVPDSVVARWRSRGIPTAVNIPK